MIRINLNVETASYDPSRQLKVKIKELKDPSHLKALARSVSEDLSSLAPVEDYLLVRKLEIVEGPHNEGNKTWVGVAPFSEVGDPGESAPKGTIADFLKDNPQYKFTKSVKNFDPRLAWWYLPHQGRQELNMARFSGMYGGANSSGKVVPAYWFLQETGTYPSRSPIAKMFVDFALRKIATSVQSTYSFLDR